MKDLWVQKNGWGTLASSIFCWIEDIKDIHDDTYEKVQFLLQTPLERWNSIFKI